MSRKVLLEALSLLSEMHLIESFNRFDPLPKAP